MSRHYTFAWELIGDIAQGRPNLGVTTRLEVYRLMQYCFRDVLEQRLGTAEADALFYDAGKLAGQHFYRQLIGEMDDFQAFIARLQCVLREMGIGILRVERADLSVGELVITVSEDLDCSGLPECDTEICVYDEGFICALLESFTGLTFQVEEVDCWCSGDRTCRFRAKVVAA